MFFLYALLFLILIYIIARIWRYNKESKLHKHSLCCDECKIKDLCDKYKDKTNL